MIEEIFRNEWPRVVASLVRRFGDLDIAEEAAGEAFLAAVTAWGRAGTTPAPPNPGGWLMTTATRKAIDRIRRESQRGDKHAEALMLQPAPEPVQPVEDDQLRLIFTCAHPALAPEARLALTLRLVAGLTVGEIARALLSTEAAIGQRIHPSPVVALNRAVVTAELDGPDAALAAIDRLPLQDYHAFHATRAELLRRVGRSAGAYAAYTRAIELAGNPAEVRHLTRRRGELVTDIR